MPFPKVKTYCRQIWGEIRPINNSARYGWALMQVCPSGPAPSRSRRRCQGKRERGESLRGNKLEKRPVEAPWKPPFPFFCTGRGRSLNAPAEFDGDQRGCKFSFDLGRGLKSFSIFSAVSTHFH